MRVIVEFFYIFLFSVDTTRYIRIIGDSWKNNKGVIRVKVKYLDELKMSLGLIKKLDNKKVIVNVIGVSGILKKAKSKFMEG